MEDFVSYDGTKLLTLPEMRVRHVGRKFGPEQWRGGGPQTFGSSELDGPCWGPAASLETIGVGGAGL
eukprot:4024134-Pyramimonas_sp.AAC.1